MFRLLLAWDGLIGLVLLYFFAVGLADGSVSAFNLGLWLGMLAAVAGILGGAWALHRAGKRRTALALLWLLAAPGLAYALFIGLILVTNPRWN
jgi:hypothetical protein